MVQSMDSGAKLHKLVSTLPLICHMTLSNYLTFLHFKNGDDNGIHFKKLFEDKVQIYNPFSKILGTVYVPDFFLTEQGMHTILLPNTLIVSWISTPYSHTKCSKMNEYSH